MAKEKILKIIEDATGKKMPPFLVGGLKGDIHYETPFISNIFISKEGNVFNYPPHKDFQSFVCAYPDIRKTNKLFNKARELANVTFHEFGKGVYLDVYGYWNVYFKESKLKNFKNLKNYIENAVVNKYIIKLKKKFNGTDFAGLSLEIHKKKNLLYGPLFLLPVYRLNPHLYRDNEISENNLLKGLIRHEQEVFEKDKSKHIIKNRGNIENVLEIMKRHRSIMEYSRDEYSGSLFGVNMNKVFHGENLLTQFVPEKFWRFYNLIKNFEY